MLAIIGGSGLYALDELEIVAEHDIETPFGKPSAPIIEGKVFGSSALFLPRHGRNHEFILNTFVVDLIFIRFYSKISVRKLPWK